MKRERTEFKHIPALIVYEGRLEDAAQKGCILFFHGLGASKEVQLKDLESLANCGFLAVGVDNVGHGERKYPDFEQRLSQANPDFNKEFLNVVSRTAREVPLLVNELTRVGFVKDEGVGTLGISMGGYIAYSAILEEPRLKVAATIVASPEWMLELPESPHRHLGGFADVKLLSQTAGRDEVVPSRHARAFHDNLKAAYSDYDERFAYYDYFESDHLLNPDWERCWARTLGWFKTHLTL